MYSSLLPIFLASLLSFLLNFFYHHNLLVSLLNCLILGLSIYLFQHLIDRKKTYFNFFFITSLGLVPLFNYIHNYALIAFVPIFSLIILYWYKYFPKWYILVVWTIVFILGNLYSGEVIKYPFEIQTTQLIFNSPEINYHINRHQEDALYIPYKLRQIIYSQTIYIYALLTNFFDFLNLKNLYQVLLLANLYPLFIGIYKVFRNENRFKSLFIVTFVATILVCGVDRSPDKFQSLYPLSPFLIYLILLGADSINKKLYLFLLLLSVFILINPL